MNALFKNSLFIELQLYMIVGFCFYLDVKPNNVLVNSSGHVKLCDFGVSIQVRTQPVKSKKSMSGGVSFCSIDTQKEVPRFV